MLSFTLALVVVGTVALVINRATKGKSWEQYQADCRMENWLFSNRK